MPQQAPPEQGKPPSLYSRRAHEVLQSLLGTPEPAAPMAPGIGQDVGAGSDVGVGASRPMGGAPLADVNQNTLPGLTPSQAAAFCGPAGVLDLMQQYEGGNIPVAEVIAQAQRTDPLTNRPYWQGQMNGPQEFANLLDHFGYEPTQIALLDARGRPNADGWRQVESALRRGQRVSIDTPGHYFQAESIDDAGNIRYGDTVGARRGTAQGPEGVTAMGYGAPRTAITATPRPGGPAEARQAPETGSMRLLSSQGSQSQGNDRAANVARVLQANAPPDLANDPEFIRVGLAITNAESGWGASRSGDSGASTGLWHWHRVNLRPGEPDWRNDDNEATRRRMPALAENYRRFTAEGLTGPELAAAVGGYTQRPLGYNQRSNTYDMNSGSANNYRRGYQAASGVNVAASGAAPDETLWDRIPEPIRASLTAFVDRASGATPAYAGPDAQDVRGGAVTGPSPRPFTVEPNQPLSNPLSGSPEDINRRLDTGTAGAQQVIGGAASAIGTTARGAADAVGGALAPFGRSAANIGTPTQAQQAAAASRPPPPPPAGPAAPGTPFGQAITQAQRAAQSQPGAVPPAGSSSDPGWGTSPGPVGPQPGGSAVTSFAPGSLGEGNWTTGQPPSPTKPSDPRLSQKDANGFPVYGPAGTFLPTPGMPHIPALIYGPDEGDGLGKAVDDTDLLKRVQEAAHQMYMHGLSRAEKEADNEIARATIREKMDTAQKNFETARADRDERVRTAREGQAAARSLQEQRIAAEALQHAQTLVGPADFKIPQGSAPGGITVDTIGGWAYARGADGNVIATYPIPRPAPTGKHVAGFGIQEETTDPVTRQLSYRPTGQYAQTVVDGRVLQESPRGLEQASRLSVDPQVTRWTDEWGRERSMNTRTGERFVHTEGAPVAKQIGQRTYMVPPPETPRYEAPMYSPTTYGAPETPWAGQQGMPLLPGVVRLPNGMIRVPDEYFGQPQQVTPQQAAPQPVFVNPEPQPETNLEPGPMEGYYA